MSTIYQINNEVYINGIKIEQPKSLFFNNCVCQINNKVYINGKEFKKSKWKYTIKSIFYTIF